MNTFLENVGLIAICFLIMYGIKKIMEYYDYKHSVYYASEKVYKAANKFASGAPSDDVKSLLESCIDFDDEDAEKILSCSFPHRNDKDGGYCVFIKSVNKVLGEDVYSEQSHSHSCD